MGKTDFFTLRVYGVIKGFPKEEVCSLMSRHEKAVSSIPADITKGCRWDSQPDFVKPLHIAPGSANEAEYHLILSNDLTYFNSRDLEVLCKLVNEIKAMLITLSGKPGHLNKPRRLLLNT